ncbi:MAG: RNA 2',3'-cyclic phosphodiesterase [Candidatus Micrarchaeaceae archaeon]
MGFTRAFTAIDVPDSIKDRIAEVEKELEGGGMRLADRESLHITLHFLGEIKDSTAEKVEKLMDRISARPFEISLGGIGFFEPGRPRVVFIGIEKGKEEINEIYEQLRAPMLEMGLRLDNREFLPHLTIARVKPWLHLSMEALEEFARGHAESFGSFTCNCICLKRSDFSGGKVKHTIIYKKSL